jgi:F-type H+-transporting ATPase subunit epsilon
MPRTSKYNSFKVYIVSIEEEIFSGSVIKLFANGAVGEMQIMHGHAPLLTALSPGPVWLEKADGKDEGIVILGGFLEVQPEMTIILADAAIKANDIIEADALQTSEKLKQQFSNKQQINYAKAQAELSSAIAQLRLIKQLRNIHK